MLGKIVCMPGAGRGPRELVPKDELRRVVWEARLFLLVFPGALVAAVAPAQSCRCCSSGCLRFTALGWLWFFGITQHAGLREDVLDHRLSTRTVYIDPVFRFLYLNMNYHVEHHMFPAVPYYNLPALHEEIKAYLPPPRRRCRRLPGGLPRPRETAAAQPGNCRCPRCPTGPRWRGPPPWPRPCGSRPPGATGGRGPGTAVDLGPAEALSVGQVVRVDHEGSTYALYRLGEDDFALTDGLCTHARSHLADGHLDGGIIECAKHNGRFDVRTGEAVRRPPLVPLCTYAVWVVDGRLVADLVTARPDEPSRLQGTS